jgi:energy-coupling factor transporter ATP-binding protein EcfA2
MKINIPTFNTDGDFNFIISPGERALFLGPNGAGKSRLGAYIEAELSKHISENKNQNVTSHTETNNIEQQIIELENQIQQTKSTPTGFLATGIKNHQDLPVHPFVPNSLSRKQILELLFNQHLQHLDIQFSNISAKSLPPNNLGDIDGGTINIAGVIIDIELMKVDPNSQESVDQYFLKKLRF